MRLNIEGGFYLSSVQTSDAQKYTEHFADGEISQYIPHIPCPYTKNIADWWIGHRNEITKREGKELFFAIRNSEDILIGAVGVNDFPFGSFHRAEVEFWLAKAYRGHGVMTNALRAFVQYAFENFEIVRLVAHTLYFNTASIRVLEKNGFILEGRLRKHTRTREGRFDTFIYGLLKEDLNI